MTDNERYRIFCDLRDNHWKHLQDWKPVEDIIDKVAKHEGCSVDELREIMREIELKYPKVAPKPKQKWRRPIEFKKPCRTCGTVIGFVRTDAGNLMPINLHDFSNHWNCEKPAKPKRKGN